MLNFLIVGDWGRRGTISQRAVARGMARKALHVRSRLVISTGDNFYEDGVEGLNDSHWRESFEDVYTAPSLQTPWYVALGNHDYRGCVDAQIAYTRQSGRWCLPARYHALTAPIDECTRVLFVFVDTTPFLRRYHAGGAEFIEGVGEQDTGAQLAWLQRTLARSTAEWKVVVGHHPLLSGSPYHGSTTTLRSAVEPLLKRYGVQVYLAGHEHDLQHLFDGALHHVISGASTDWRPTGEIEATCFSMATRGFVVGSLRRSRLCLRYCNARGKALYAAEIPQENGQPHRSGRSVLRVEYVSD